MKAIWIYMKKCKIDTVIPLFHTMSLTCFGKWALLDVSQHHILQHRHSCYHDYKLVTIAVSSGRSIFYYVCFESHSLAKHEQIIAADLTAGFVSQNILCRPRVLEVIHIWWNKVLGIQSVMLAVQVYNSKTQAFPGPMCLSNQQELKWWNSRRLFGHVYKLMVR